MRFDLLRRAAVAIVAALVLGAGLGFSVPRAAGVSPAVAVGLPRVAPDMTLARIPIVSPAVDLTASGPDGPLPIRDGVLEVPLRLVDHGRQALAVEIDASGATLGRIEIRYYPASYYRVLSSPHPGALLVFTDLPRTGAPRWANGTDTARQPTDSLVVDAARWADARRVGGMPSDTLDRDEQVRRLYTQMEGENEATGTLCDERLASLAAYERLSAGSCAVNCFGYARILRDLLRSDGTPARVISLGAVKYTLPSGVVVQSSEGHQTTELWDGEGWAWIDGTLGVLRAIGPDGDSLSTEETVVAVSDPATRSAISFTRLDPTTGGWVTRSYGEQDEAFKILLASTLTADKVLSIPDDGRG